MYTPCYRYHGSFWGFNPLIIIPKVWFFISVCTFRAWNRLDVISQWGLHICRVMWHTGVPMQGMWYLDLVFFFILLLSISPHSKFLYHILSHFSHIDYNTILVNWNKILPVFDLRCFLRLRDDFCDPQSPFTSPFPLLYSVVTYVIFTCNTILYYDVWLFLGNDLAYRSNNTRSGAVHSCRLLEMACLPSDLIGRPMWSVRWGWRTAFQ